MTSSPALLLLATVVVLGASLACQGAPATPPTAPATAPKAPAATTAATPVVEKKVPTGDLVVGIPTPGTLSLDPGAGTAFSTLQFAAHVFDSLTWVRQMNSAEISPLLATSWSTADGRVWEFKLRDDVRFSNGEPFTAESVKFSFDYYRNPDNRTRLATVLPAYESITVVDPATVRFTLRDADPTIPFRMANALMLPPQAFQQAGSLERFLQNPVGTGPWRSTLADPNRGFAFEARTEPPSPRGVPNLKTITYRVVPETGSRIAALRTGEIDVAGTVGGDQAKELQASNFKVSVAPGDSMLQFVLRTESGPLADKRVRQAVNHGVDKQLIVDTVLAGFGQLDPGQLIGPSALGYNPNVRAYRFDQARARQLMAEAGYANGFRGRMTVLQNPVAGAEIGQAIAAQLRQIGIDLTINPIESAVWARLALAASWDERGEFFVNLNNWAQTGEAGNVYRQFTADEAQRNFWRNEPFNALYQRAKSTIDRTERGRLYQQMAELIHDEAPVLFLWNLVGIAAMKPNVNWTAGVGMYVALEASKS